MLDNKVLIDGVCCLLQKKKMGFTPRKAERQLQGMELQEKETQKD